MNKLTTTVVTLVSTIVLVFATMVTPAHAAPTGLYLSPSSGNYAYNANFSVQIRLNGGRSGVNANLTFDISKLFVNGMSSVGSAYSGITTHYDNNAGTISAYATNGHGIGDELVATIVFHTIGSGAANVNFSGTNQVMDVAFIVPVWSNVGTTNSTYTIAAAPAPPQGSGGTTPPSTPVAQPQNGPLTSHNTSPISQPDNTTTEPIPTSPEAQISNDAQDLGIDNTNNFVAAPAPEKAKDTTVSPVVTTMSPKNLQQFLPALIGLVLSLAAVTVFINYRRSAIIGSLQRLIAAAALARLTMRDGSAVLAVFQLTLLPLKKASVVITNIPHVIAPTIATLATKKQLFLPGGSKAPAAKRWTSRH